MQHRVLWAAVLAVVGAGITSLAHVSYSGRTFGPLVIGGPAVSITNQTVSSSFGWADATDADWGDSHRTRFFRFTLTNQASVTVTAQRNGGGNQTNAGGVANSFLPAVSLYYGLGQGSTTNDGVIYESVFRSEQQGHDASVLSTNSRPSGTEGSLRSMSSWSIGNDDTYVTNGNPTSGILIPARLAYFTYIGSAADGVATNYGPAIGVQGDGLADGYVTATFNNLPTGEYSLVVGGANYSAQLLETGPSTFPTYGVNMSVRASPLTAYEDGKASVTSNPTAYNLYTPASIQDLNLGGLMIQGGGTSLTVRIQLQGTDSLELPRHEVRPSAHPVRGASPASRPTGCLDHRRRHRLHGRGEQRAPASNGHRVVAACR